MCGACELMNKFTRFSGELFGMFIAFMQQAIKGVVRVSDQASVRHRCQVVIPPWPIS
jgi:hypothetical protein